MARMTRTTRKRLGEILLDEGLLGQEQLLAALDEQRRTGELLGEVLVRLGYATEDDVAGTIAMQFALPYLPVTKYQIREEVVSVFPQRLLRQYQFVPVDKIGGILVLVAGSLLTPDILSELEQMAGCRIQVYVGKQSEVRHLIEERFSPGSIVDQMKAAPQMLSGLGQILLGNE